MRIGFDAKRAYNNFSGLGNYSRYVINGLIELFPQDVFYAYTPKVNENLEGQVTNNVVVVKPNNFLDKKFKSYWRSRSITTLASKSELNIYHGLSNELPKGIEESGVKSVVTIHDLIFIRYPDLYKSVDRKIYRRKFKLACLRADKIIAISEQTKADIVEYFKIDPERIEVVYQDCSTIYHKPVDKDLVEETRKKFNLPDDYLLSVGTIEARKNQLNLVKAFCQLETDHKLVLVGKHTSYAGEIKEYLKSTNRVDDVIFINSVDQKFLPAIYSMATIFIYPSIFEGFGIPIIEAQNMKVPVITSTGSCFGETGGDGALYADPNNTEEIKDQIQSLLGDENKRKELVNLGLKNCQRFKAEVTIPQIYNIYKSLL